MSIDTLSNRFSPSRLNVNAVDQTSSILDNEHNPLDTEKFNDIFDKRYATFKVFSSSAIDSLI